VKPWPFDGLQKRRPCAGLDGSRATVALFDYKGRIYQIEGRALPSAGDAAIDMGASPRSGSPTMPTLIGATLVVWRGRQKTRPIEAAIKQFKVAPQFQNRLVAQRRA
jgi:hypothetical protein